MQGSLPGSGAFVDDRNRDGRVMEYAASDRAEHQGGRPVVAPADDEELGGRRLGGVEQGLDGVAFDQCPLHVDVWVLVLQWLGDSVEQFAGQPLLVVA